MPNSHPDDSIATTVSGHQITLAQWPTQIPYRHGSLLDAILSAGVPFPHACSAGDCGQCKCKLVDGQVDMEAFSPEALTAQEAARGEILACRAYPKGPVSISWLADDDEACFTIRYGQARVQSVDVLGETGYLRLKLQIMGAALQFAPGQFIRLELGDMPSRCYSLVNRPGEQVLELLVRRRTNGLYSDYMENKLRVGEKVNFEGPYGEAFWRGRHDGPVVIAAIGGGMSFAISVLMAALNDRQRELTVWQFSAGRPLLQDEQLKKLASKYGFVYQGFQCEAQGLDHLLTAFHSLDVDVSQLKMYLSGDPAAMPHLAKEALSMDLDPENLIAEPFYPSKVRFPDSWWSQLTSRLRFWR